MTAPSTMLLTYKYRVNPTRAQHRALENILEQQRQLYNGALEERIEAYRKGVTISEAAQSKSLTLIRRDDPLFAGVQRRIQRETLRRLDRAYKAFFRRAKAGAGASSGFPKFKGRDYFDGFGFDAFAQIKWDGKRLRFDGMAGGLRVHLDRPLPSPLIKGIWFKREGLKWFCGFQVETPIEATRVGRGKGAIGVDWGTSVLAALSSGEMIANPRHGEALADELARAQRKVARAKKGGKGRLKARRHKQSIERRIANRRRNTMDKLSKRLVTHWRVVATEKIAARDLMNAERPGETLPAHVKRRRNREALDAAPYLLRQMTDYKARRYGARHIEIDPTAKLADGTRAQPTQRCSMCGGLHFKKLTDAEHVCTTPGVFYSMRLPRKVNAARVILSLASDGEAIPPTKVDGNGGGPVPGGLDGGSDVAAVRKAHIGAPHLGNTGVEQSASGRRGDEPLPKRLSVSAPLKRPPKVSGW